MADYTHTDLQLVGRHVPDEGGGPFENMNQAMAAGHDVVNPVTGMYEIGVLIEGAFVPLITEKASLVFDRIEIAKQAQASQAETASTQAAGSTQANEGEGAQPDTGPLSDQAAPTDSSQG